MARLCWLSVGIALLASWLFATPHGNAEDAKVLKAGAHAIDITPERLPVLVNGGMYSRNAGGVVDRLHARCIVLDDGTTKIAIVVVDSCMVPRDLLDEAKALAAKATGIPVNRMLISATHTHSAPAAMGALGTDRDDAYCAFLPARIARGIQLAHDNLELARVGWAKSRDPENVYHRRWLMKEGKAATNPFSGKTNDRAQMNPGHNNPNKIRRTGTVDDEVWVLSIQSTEGRPIALLANYSTHYAGSPALSSDYFGAFAEKIEKELTLTLGKGGQERRAPPPVAIMSNGTSGDTNCIDFTRGDRRKFTYHTVAEDTARAAMEAYEKIKYVDYAPIEMEESLLTLDVRMPTDDEVAKAKAFLATEEGKKLRSVKAVYARETVLLSEMPATRQLKIQAIRIGGLGITAMPNEVFTATGLAIKKESPLAATFNISLANGAEGYIPPPDQHKLGGYTTWRARTSCLEEEAEPKIRAEVLKLLKKVASVEREAQTNQEDNAEEARPSLETCSTGEFRAGAYAIDITPTKFPVVVNGNFTEQSARAAHGKLHARCLVLEDGKERIAIAIVDSLMMPRELIDEAKRLAAKATGIRADRMLIAATHTHSAPSVMGCLGSGTDDAYIPFLTEQIARGIHLASERVAPAKMGFAVLQADEHTHCRRWLTRPDRVGTDPFGQKNVRAMMHPGYQNANYLGPAGPVDAGLSILAIQSTSGSPIAVLANYSMHYFGAAPVSADYFGPFCDVLQEKIDAQTEDAQRGDHPLVAMMSQGTSGDLHWMDYSQPRRRTSMDEYARQVAGIAFEAYEKIEYESDISLAMDQLKVELERRTPDEQRLAWAKDIVEKLGDGKPKSRGEIYAREAVLLHEQPRRELILQAIRIGDVGITALPNEVFGITGLRLKHESPLPKTFNISLANGAEGYIPTPQQHRLGGYTTWPARTAGLEEKAEPTIVEGLLRALEKVSGQRRRYYPLPRNRYSVTLREAEPLAYWWLDDLSADHDLLRGPGAKLEGAVALFLEGVPFEKLDDQLHENRAVQLAGGRIVKLGIFGGTYTAEFWFENRLPNDARPVTGYLFSRGPDGAEDCPGDHLGIMGTHDAENAGRLFFFNGNARNETATGKTRIQPFTWNHVALVRDGNRVQVYLNGQIEIDAEVERTIAGNDLALREFPLFFGGRSDNFANFAGKLDEIALFDKVLSGDDIAKHFASAGIEVAKPRAAADRLPASPLSPEDSLKHLHVRPGMKVELVAAEPLVRDPVAFDWGPDGKLWVVEYLDYPTGIDGKGTGGGRVVFLEDENSDGRYDQSTLFLDKLNFPTGVMAWRDGVLITAAPDILFAKDTDDDGKADAVEKLYTGFHEANQQLRVNGLRWGLDNWIHCASGSHHAGYGKESKIKSTKTGELVHIGARDFRIQPDEGLIEPTSGPSQFGRNRDAWGNWFGTQNAKPMFHYVLEDRYLRRNPHVTYPQSQILISDVPGQRPVFARSQPGKFHHASQAGRFTSANSAMIYGDELLGEEFIGNSFVSEPVHNLVHREIVERNGVTFKSHKPKDEEQTEFLSSEDTWFRPTTIRTGPDGALWVADMYREIIEHPRWVSDDLKPIVDTRNGTDRGRIYRIYPEGAKPRAIPRIDELKPEALAALLESPSATVRDMAQMRIVNEQLKEAAPALRKLATDHHRPQTRLQTLCTLQGLDALDAAFLRGPLNDKHPGVRAAAVRLLEPFIAKVCPDGGPLLGMREDSDAAVRLQLALSTGEWVFRGGGHLLMRLAAEDSDDPFLVAAVLSSLNETNVESAVNGLLVQPARPSPKANVLAGVLATAIGLEASAAVTTATKKILERDSNGRLAEWQLQSLVVLLDELARQQKFIEAAVDESAKDQAADDLETAFGLARKNIAATDVNDNVKTLSIELLGRQTRPSEADYKLIASGLSPNRSAEMQSSAVDALTRTSQVQAAEIMLENWNSHGPNLRAEILDALFARGTWTDTLLTAVENNRVAASDIGAARRARLLKSKNPRVQERAAKLFAGTIDADRAKVISQYQPVLESLSAEGGTERGRAVFKQRCSACHRLDEVGNHVGPDLKGLTDKSPAHLLTSILDPNRAVEPKYLSYTAVTERGRIYNGVLADESGGSLTLLDAEGKQHAILRRDLDELTASGKSLMPEGLEKDIDPAAMRDLLTYLQQALK